MASLGKNLTDLFNHEYDVLYLTCAGEDEIMRTKIGVNEQEEKLVLSILGGRLKLLREAIG